MYNSFPCFECSLKTALSVTACDCANAAPTPVSYKAHYVSPLPQEECPVPALVYSQDFQPKPKSHLHSTKANSSEHVILFTAHCSKGNLARWLVIAATCSSKLSVSQAHQNPTIIARKLHTGSQDRLREKKIKKRKQSKVKSILDHGKRYFSKMATMNRCHCHNAWRSHAHTPCGSEAWWREMAAWSVQCKSFGLQALQLSSPVQTGRPTAPA